jgi:predicted nucleic acid-binding protein
VILVDTGPVVAAINRRDPDHTRCRKLLDDYAGQLLITPYVVAEICWMAASRLGAHAEANVVDAVAAGDFTQVTIEPEDLVRISEFLHKYHDLHSGDGLSIADASVAAVAERLNIREIATLDVTDFSLIRPRHLNHFTLL